MSHKATSWLATVDPKAVNGSQFRVLFHLCDCHNPSAGCFPTQAYLAENSGISRRAVNDVLKVLEGIGLITRHQSVDPNTRKQRPTRYMLPFEKGFQPHSSGGVSADNPVPQSDNSRVQSASHGAVCNPAYQPCEVERTSRVQSASHKPVKEPVINQRAGATELEKLDAAARFWGEKIAAGKVVAISAINVDLADRMLALKLVTKDELRKRGIPF